MLSRLPRCLASAVPGSDGCRRDCLPRWICKWIVPVFNSMSMNGSLHRISERPSSQVVTIGVLYTPPAKHSVCLTWADIFELMGGTETGACTKFTNGASSLLLWCPFRLLMTFADILKTYLIKTAELLFPFCCTEILTYCLLTSFSWHWLLYHLLVGFYLSWPDFVCASAWGHRRRLVRGLTAVAAPRHTASCLSVL